MGKGSKERSLPFSPRTGQAIWKYLAARTSDHLNDPLFATGQDSPLSRDRLLKTIAAIARRAGVQEANVHRFRHTFATNFLRNGGDPWTLQAMLGHSTMDMVHRYLEIVQVDLDSKHQLASPISNWRL